MNVDVDAITAARHGLTYAEGVIVGLGSRVDELERRICLACSIIDCSRVRLGQKPLDTEMLRAVLAEGARPDLEKETSDG